MIERPEDFPQSLHELVRACDVGPVVLTFATVEEARAFRAKFYRFRTALQDFPSYDTGLLLIADRIRTTIYHRAGVAVVLELEAT